MLAVYVEKAKQKNALTSIVRGSAFSMALLVCMTVMAAPAHAYAEDTFAPPTYQLIRYNEDYSYLKDTALRTDIWDPVKYIPLASEGAVFLSLGGELRERYEYFNNTDWGQGPQDNNGYLLQRYMLHADLHIGPHVRAFGQLKSCLEDGRAGGPRPPDRDRLDLHQAFLDLSLSLGGDSSLLIRAGRQEIALGSQRLVGVREGPNVRRSFDGARMTLRAGGWCVDGFITRPVKTREDVFDDDSDPKASFWGIYSTGPIPLMPEGKVDVYYLGLDRSPAHFDQGTAHEHRHTIGTRLFGNASPLDYNFEFVYQWGSFGTGDILAWTAASDTGLTISDFPLSPRLGIKANVTSGDRDSKSPDLQTFNPLFPKGAYFNEADLVGPANHMDVHPSIDLHVIRPLTVIVDWDFFWRESTRDGVYGNAVNVLRSGSSGSARYVGSALSFAAKWRIDRHITLVGYYTRFFSGPFIRQSGPGSDVDYLSALAEYKF